MASTYFYQDDLYSAPLDLAKVLGISVQALHKANSEYGINTLVQPRKHKVFPEQTREILKNRNLSYPKLCIHLHNSKGGVGKTTLAHAISLKGAMLGFKTLAIDLDPQANLTKSFGTYQRSQTRPNFKSLTFGEFDNRKITPSDAIIKLHEYLDLIPSDMSMANFDLELVLKSAGQGVNTFFKPLFDNFKKHYDLIIVDSPPAISTVTLGATFNSDKLLIPTEADEFSIDGIDQVFQQIHVANTEALNIRPIVCVNKISQAREHDLARVAEIYNTYGEYVLGASLPFTSKFKEQIKDYQNIWKYFNQRKPDTINYLEAVVHEILDLNNWAVGNTTKTQLSKEANA